MNQKQIKIISVSCGDTHKAAVVDKQAASIYVQKSNVRKEEIVDG